MAIKSVEIDLSQLTPSQLRQIYPKYARLANARLRELDLNDVDYYAYERAVKDLGGRNRFPAGVKSLTDNALYNLAASVTTFINSESSTITGLNNINHRRIETIKEQVKLHYNQGYIDLPNGASKQEFFAFLDTPEFYNKFSDFLEENRLIGLTRYGDSNDVIDDVALALFEEFSVDDIFYSYNQFLDSDNLQFDEVAQYRRDSINLK